MFEPLTAKQMREKMPRYRLSREGERFFKEVYARIDRAAKSDHEYLKLPDNEFFQYVIKSETPEAKLGGEVLDRLKYLGYEIVEVNEKMSSGAVVKLIVRW